MMRALLALLYSTLFALTGGAASAETGSHIQLRGTARLDAQASRKQGALVLRGTVSDDSGAVVPGGAVSVGLTQNGRTVSLSSAAPEDCGSEGGVGSVHPRAPAATQHILLDGPDRITLPTDRAGQFCVSLSVPIGRYDAHLDARGSGFLDGTRIDLAVDLALAGTHLRFDPDPPPLSLEDATNTIDVVASTEDEGSIGTAGKLPLTLTNESGAVLGEATTDASGRARFDVDGARLGPIGKGELRVSFAGSGSAAPTSHVASVLRRTRVTLDVPDAAEGKLRPGSPESGIALRIVATPMCALRGCSAHPTGTVEVCLTTEATKADTIVAAAPLELGEARVVAKFETPLSADELALRVRYEPDVPWFQPTEGRILSLPIRPPIPWDRIACTIAGLVVIVWLAAGRLRDPPIEGRNRRPREAAMTHAGVELVRAAAALSEGWTGRIVDAHDGAPIPSSRVAIERPGFQSTATIAETLSDSGGAFELVSPDVGPGDQLVAEGSQHVTMRQTLPARGELKVALVSRKRALVDRFVRWARRRGPPFDAQPEPTPLHVRRVAPAAGAAESVVKNWADAVERAAFAGDPVDAEVEATIDKLAPADAAGPRDSGAR